MCTNHPNQAILLSFHFRRLNNRTKTEKHVTTSDADKQLPNEMKRKKKIVAAVDVTEKGSDEIEKDQSNDEAKANDSNTGIDTPLENSIQDATISKGTNEDIKYVYI